MNENIIHSIDNAINKNRKYNHTVDRQKKAKNKEKRVKRTTSYSSIPYKAELIELDTALLAAKLFLSDIKETETISDSGIELLDRIINHIDNASKTLALVLKSDQD